MIAVGKACFENVLSVLANSSLGNLTSAVLTVDLGGLIAASGDNE